MASRAIEATRAPISPLASVSAERSSRYFPAQGFLKTATTATLRNGSSAGCPASPSVSSMIV